MTLFVKLLSCNSLAPVRSSVGAAAYDLFSSEDASVSARGRALVSTGIAISLPKDTYGRIAPRSGLAHKFGLDIGAGVIDPDYTGEVKVVIFNHSDSEYSIKKGDRIAQLLIVKVQHPEIVITDNLESTNRGSGGFGSTGI